MNITNPLDGPFLQDNKTGRRWKRWGSVLYFSKPGLKKTVKNDQYYNKKEKIT